MTIEDIRAEFGEAVALIVEGLTDPPEMHGLPILVRLTLQAERIRDKGRGVKLVKIADQASNVNSVAPDPPLHWDRQDCLDYIEGAKLVVRACRGTSAYLEVCFDELYAIAMNCYSYS